MNWDVAGLPSELLAAGPWAVFDVALLDKTTRIVLGVLLAVLAIAYGVGRVLRRQALFAR